MIGVWGLGLIGFRVSPLCRLREEGLGQICARDDHEAPMQNKEQEFSGGLSSM